MDKKIEYQAYNIKPQFLRSDDSFRIQMDISQDQVENVKDVILRRLPNGLYKITIELIEKEERGAV